MTDIYICFFFPSLMIQACWLCPWFSLCNSVWWLYWGLKFCGGVCFQLVMNFLSSLEATQFYFNHIPVFVR